MNFQEQHIFHVYPDVLTIAEMQEALGIGRSMAYRLIKGGKVKHLRIGKKIKIPKRFLVDYVLDECYTDDDSNKQAALSEIRRNGHDR